MPYLVDVLKGLPTAKWLEAREPALLSNSPLAGEFGFCFVTLMSALAAKDNSLDGDIIKLQLSLFNTLIDQCCAYQDLADHKKGNLWTCHILQACVLRSGMERIIKYNNFFYSVCS